MWLMLRGYLDEEIDLFPLHAYADWYKWHFVIFISVSAFFLWAPYAAVFHGDHSSVSIMDRGEEWRKLNPLRTKDWIEMAAKISVAERDRASEREGGREPERLAASNKGNQDKLANILSYFPHSHCSSLPSLFYVSQSPPCFPKNKSFSSKEAIGPYLKHLNSVFWRTKCVTE